MRNFLTDRVDVYREFRQNVSGTLQPTFSRREVVKGILGRLEDLSGSWALTVLGRIPDATHQVFFEASAPVEVSDVLVVGGQEYVVRSVTRARGARDVHHLETIVRSVQKRGA